MRGCLELLKINKQQILAKIMTWFCLLLMTQVVLGQSVILQGTKKRWIHSASLKRSSRIRLLSSSSPYPVTVLTVKLSSEIKQAIQERIHSLQSDHTDKAVQSEQYPREVQLGMNGVPVLDQGEHGTCVLFSMTAALDAAIGQGDYISQICQLELGNYLHNNSYHMLSGWEGSRDIITAGQFESFGFVSKSVQLAGGCAGVQEYPLHDQHTEAELSVFDFHQVSESLDAYELEIHPLILHKQANGAAREKNKILSKVKSLLNQGDRVTIGVLLSTDKQDQLEILGKYHVASDTWILRPEMANRMPEKDEFDAHEIIVTGYNDDAIAFDEDGHASKGLLTLRNSWGSEVGDQGDFYMSYNYFNAFLLDASYVHKIQPEDR